MDPGSSSAASGDNSTMAHPEPTPSSSEHINIFPFSVESASLAEMAENLSISNNESQSTNATCKTPTTPAHPLHLTQTIINSLGSPAIANSTEYPTMGIPSVLISQTQPEAVHLACRNKNDKIRRTYSNSNGNKRVTESNNKHEELNRDVKIEPLELSRQQHQRLEAFGDFNQLPYVNQPLSTENSNSSLTSATTAPPLIPLRPGPSFQYPQNFQPNTWSHIVSEQIHAGMESSQPNKLSATNRFKSDSINPLVKGLKSAELLTLSGPGPVMNTPFRNLVKLSSEFYPSKRAAAAGRKRSEGNNNTNTAEFSKSRRSSRRGDTKGTGTLQKDLKRLQPQDQSGLFSPGNERSSTWTQQTTSRRDFPDQPKPVEVSHSDDSSSRDEELIQTKFLNAHQSSLVNLTGRNKAGKIASKLPPGHSGLEELLASSKKSGVQTSTNTMTQSSSAPSWSSQFSVKPVSTAGRKRSELKFSKVKGRPESVSKYPSFTNSSLESRDKLPTLVPSRNYAKGRSRAADDVNMRMTEDKIKVEPDMPVLFASTQSQSNMAGPPRTSGLSSVGPPSLLGMGHGQTATLFQKKELKLIRKAYAITNSGKLVLVKELASIPPPLSPIIQPNVGSGDPAMKKKSSRNSKPTVKQEPSERKLSKRRQAKSKENVDIVAIKEEPPAHNSWTDEALISGDESKVRQRGAKDGRLATTTAWSYTEEELVYLYKHNSFLIKKEDMSTKAPKDRFYCIYRIVVREGTTVLQRYIPKDTGDRIFHFATNECMVVPKIDHEFQGLYQPVYFGVCFGEPEDPNVVLVLWRARIMPTLKYVFELDGLFKHFGNLLRIITAQVMTMTEVQRILDEDDDYPAKKSWLLFTNMIEKLAAQIYDNNRWNHKVVEELKIWPRMTMSIKGVEKNRVCEVCVEQRISVRRAIVCGLPYDPVHHNPLGVYPDPGKYHVTKPVQCCYICYQILISGHRLLHLKNDLFSCVLDTYDKRVKAEPGLLQNGPALFESILEYDGGHWAREMFVDFCITIGDGQKALQKIEKEVQRKLRSEDFAARKSVK